MFQSKKLQYKNTFWYKINFDEKQIFTRKKIDINDKKVNSIRNNLDKSKFQEHVNFKNKWNWIHQRKKETQSLSVREPGIKIIFSLTTHIDFLSVLKEIIT